MIVCFSTGSYLHVWHVYLQFLLFLAPNFVSLFFMWVSGKYCMGACVCVFFAESYPSVYHTHTYMHTHMTAQQLTIILMPICLIVGFLIPRAPSSFQQGLTVLARDGFFFFLKCACVCRLVCVWCQLSHGILWFWSLSHPPFPELCFTLNISAGQLINMNYDDGYAVKQSDMNVGYRPYTPIKAEWQLKLCIDTLL